MYGVRSTNWRLSFALFFILISRSDLLVVYAAPKNRDEPFGMAEATDRPGPNAHNFTISDLQ